MIGKLMRETLENQHISITDAAKMLGISQPRLNMWLSGKNDPSTENVLRFCNMFHVTPNYLFGFEEDISEQDRVLLQAFKAMAAKSPNEDKAQNTHIQTPTQEKER